ncbi:MAG: alpha/beta hydrolase [Thermomicrobiales bacterium]
MQIATRDGVKLAYSEAGRGGPPIVFIHGLACDSSDFAPQFEYFRERHRVIAIDLRGHGASDAPEGGYSTAALADDVLWLCDELGVYKPMLVGHSMGGMIALEIAARRPGAATAIALLDSPILIPPPVAEALAPFGAALRSPAYRDALVGFMASNFGPADDPERKGRILERAGRLPQHVGAACWEQGLASYDSVAAARACTLPVLYLHAAVPSNLGLLAQLCPRLMVGETVGSGHWHQLEVPDQVNAMLDRFIDILQTNPAVIGQGNMAPAEAA